MVFLQCSAVESRAAAVFVPHRTAPCPKNVHAVFQLFLTTVNCCRGVVVPPPPHVCHIPRPCVCMSAFCCARGRSDTVRNRVPSSLSRACREGRFFAHLDAVRKVEPPAARDTFTCCSALWLLRCCRRLQHQCGCIVAAAMRCVFSSIRAAERATVSTVHLLEWHEEL